MNYLAYFITNNLIYWLSKLVGWFLRYGRGKSTKFGRFLGYRVDKKIIREKRLHPTGVYLLLLRSQKFVCLQMTFFCNMTFFCDHITKVVYINSLHYYYCTQNSRSTSDSRSGKRSYYFIGVHHGKVGRSSYLHVSLVLHAVAIGTATVKTGG